MINKRFFAELTYVSFAAKLTSGSVDIKVGYYIAPPGFSVHPPSRIGGLRGFSLDPSTFRTGGCCRGGEELLGGDIDL